MAEPEFSECYFCRRTAAEIEDDMNDAIHTLYLDPKDPPVGICVKCCEILKDDDGPPCMNNWPEEEDVPGKEPLLDAFLCFASSLPPE